MTKLLIVESPGKARRLATLLDPKQWQVMASRGHIRDLPDNVLGVDIQQDFALHYRTLPQQRVLLGRLRKAVHNAEAIYLATDPDREGEAIAWHLLEALLPRSHRNEQYDTNERSSRAPSRRAKPNAKLGSSKAEARTSGELNTGVHSPASALVDAQHLSGIPVYRLDFNELTLPAVKRAIASPRRLDMALVEAQQTRRTVDRLVGYLVSPLACEALADRVSAGRVQSVCLRLIVDREQEISAFSPTKYWTLDAQLQSQPQSQSQSQSRDTVKVDKDETTSITDPSETANTAARVSAASQQKSGAAAPQPISAALVMVQGQRISRFQQAAVHKLMAGLTSAVFWVATLKTVTRQRHPLAPFTTASLQQAASKAYGFTPDQTMKAAQQLYEAGRITYMRTDSLAVPESAQQDARAFIAEQFGARYIPAEPPVYNRPQQKSVVQRHSRDVHEAIRPTDVQDVPERLLAHLRATQNQGHDGELEFGIPSGHARGQNQRSINSHQRPQQAVQGAHAAYAADSLSSTNSANDSAADKLYELIWRRFLSSQMADASYEVSGARLLAGKAFGQPYPLEFLRYGRILQFDGFLKVYEEPLDDGEQRSRNIPFPALVEGEVLKFVGWEPKEHTTTAPDRYTDASLIRALEQRGIGRPSTYALMVRLLKEKNYVRLDQKRMVPTALANKLCAFLIHHFPIVFDYRYTAVLESELDRIATGDSGRLRTLQTFWHKHFASTLQSAAREVTGKQQLLEQQPEARLAQTAPATADPATAGPDASSGEPLPVPTNGRTCPRCGSALVRRSSKYGSFYGCADYPRCKGTAKINPPIFTGLSRGVEAERVVSPHAAVQTAQTAQTPPLPSANHHNTAVGGTTIPPASASTAATRES